MLLELWFTFLYIITGIYTKEIRWVNHLTKYLQSEAYQVLLVSEPHVMKDSSDLSEIVQEISKDVPIFSISSEEATIGKATHLSSLRNFKDPRATTVIVVICSSEGCKFEPEINFITKISEFWSRPKCLMILRKAEGGSTYEKLLEQMWARRYLDVSVLEIISEDANRERQKVASFSSEMVQMHSFNPFSGIYRNEDYTSRIKWFPERTLNLHQHEMKVGVVSYPPSADFIYDEISHIKVFGPDPMMADCLSKAMNFRIKWIISNATSAGSSSCVRENSTELFRMVMNNDIQFIAVQIGRTPQCAIVLHTTDTRPIRICVAVPNLSDEAYELTTEWKLYNLSVFISILASTWIISRCFNFEKRNWRFEYLIQVLLGYTVPQEPRKLVERIVFGSILMSCLMHSSFIHTALTSVSLKKGSEVAFSSIQDVLESNLVVWVNPTVVRKLYNYTDGSSRELLDESTQVDISNRECLKHLVTSREIACVVREDVAHWMIAKVAGRCGKPALKVVPEYLTVTVASIIVESESPYLNQFNKAILRLRSAGLVEKWQQLREGKKTLNHTENFQDCNLQSIESAQMRLQLLVLLTFGYSCAIIVFFCELLVRAITKIF